MMKVISDVDTSTDDVIAIILALLSPELDVIGIRLVNGSRGIESTTGNTLRVIEYLGAAQVPAHRGCVLPTVSTLSSGRRINIPYTGPEDPEDNVHGDYVDLPPATIKPAPGDAVSWLTDTLTELEGDTTLVPVGLLINIAMVLRAGPTITERIKQTVLIGGGCREVNITPSAEFNFQIDPEAAKTVLDSGCDITVAPSDAIHAVTISIEDAKEFRRTGMKASAMMADIIGHRWNGHKNWQPMDDINTVLMHDALAVRAVLNPQVLSPVVPVYVDINTGGGAPDGQSIFDLDRRTKRAVPNIKAALGADRVLLSKMLKEILGGNGS